MTEKKPSAAQEPKPSAQKPAKEAAAPEAPFLVRTQKRILEAQKAVFDRTFEAVSSFQERQEEATSSWLERSERVPAEIKQVAETWIDAARSGRENYRSTVEKTFELMGSFVDSLAERRA